MGEDQARQAPQAVESGPTPGPTQASDDLDVVAAAPLAATAGHAGGRLPPSALAALQRTAGNKAVQRLVLQRTGGPYAPGRITVPSKTPTVEGTASWRRKGADTVDVDGPKVTLSTNASIDTTGEDEWKELDVGSQIQVGPTQSVTGSMRSGVYKEGATGAVTATQNMKTGSSRDAQWDREKNKQVAAVPAPWYSQPSSISPNITSTGVTFFDHPGFDLPLKNGKGTLAAVRGSDNFITSIAAKTDKGRLDHLFQFSWAAPWDMDITPDQSGTGARTGVTPTELIPPTLDGPIAVQSAATWLAFTTVAQAEAAGAETLLRYLPAAAANDPAAATTIRLALKNLDPTVTIACQAEKTGNVALDARFAVVAQGTTTAEFGEKLTLDDGESGTASFKLSQLFDIATMPGAASITVTVKKYGRLFGNEGETTFKPALPPYRGSTATSYISGAKVTVTFGLA